MDAQLHLHAGIAGAIRPTLYHSKSATSAGRVTSDPVKKSSHLHRHKPHRHHHHHDHRDRHSSSRRHAAKEAVQSALQMEPPTSFGDLLKQARGSKDTTPSHSRKGSVTPGHFDGSRSGKEADDVGIVIMPRRPLRAQDVDIESKRVEARERCVDGRPKQPISTILCGPLTWNIGLFELLFSPSPISL